MTKPELDLIVEPPGRLRLPNVTLLSFDPVDPVAALRSLIWSRRHVDFAEVVLVTGTGALRRVSMEYASQNIKIRTPILDGRMLTAIGVRLLELDGIPQARREGYELYHLQYLPEWFMTSHVLYQEADGGVLNPQAWDSEWLGLDFIGAPWPYPMNEPDYPPCDAMNCVGNGGFSLRSMKLCHRLRYCLEAGTDVPQRFISDAWIGRSMRPGLEQAGMLFASHAEAERFSLENRLASGQFGFHGHCTANLNGWDRSALKLL